MCLSDAECLAKQQQYSRQINMQHLAIKRLMVVHWQSTHWQVTPYSAAVCDSCLAAFEQVMCAVIVVITVLFVVSHKEALAWQKLVKSRLLLCEPVHPQVHAWPTFKALQTLAAVDEELAA